MLFSGTTAKTLNPVLAPSGAWIDPGTDCVVMGTMRDAEPAIYMVETAENDEFESEEFYCFADDLEVA